MDNYYFSPRLLGENGEHVSGLPLKGDGMASKRTGPTKGKSNHRYVGIITTTLNSKGENIKNLLTHNQKVWDFLRNERKKGFNIVFPTFENQFSLGTGLAVKQCTEEDWVTLQKDIFKGYARLGLNMGDDSVKLFDFETSINDALEHDPNDDDELIRLMYQYKIENVDRQTEKAYARAQKLKKLSDESEPKPFIYS